MTIDTLEHDITKELYELWKAKYSFWKPGIKAFYAPVVASPKLMIITHQPGGNEKDFEKESLASFENGIFTTTVNDYVDRNYAMSKKVRTFFDFDPSYSILKQSVLMPLIFFRSPSLKVWEKELSDNKRTELEDVSFAKTKEIVDTINPEKLFVIGLKSYKKLKELLGSVDDEKITHVNGKETLAVTARYGTIEIFAITHFAGARISKTDWKELKTQFQDWFGR